MHNFVLKSKREIESCMPHSGDMVLLDRVIECDDEYVVTEVDIGPHLPCFAGDKVPAYIGLEVMAQSVSVWFGLHRENQSTPPPIGYLLGVRNFESSLAYLPDRKTFRARADQIVSNLGVGLFECKLEEGNAGNSRVPIATATISVHSMPKNQ